MGRSPVHYDAFRLNSSSDRVMEGTILVLDDGPETRKLLTGNLRQAGCRAECAAEAESQVRDLRPDVTLLE